ncbi:MAG: ribosome small subunit-dependent GTPase A [Ignavibacteriaceae bacterium]|nr:ribosome small subunit-dependent GTPase A [Ignavibacteriaceae bacterium]
MLRGKFKQDIVRKRERMLLADYAVVGDKVEYEVKRGSGVITKVFERENFISRKAPRLKGAGYRGERLEQLIVSNISQFVAVTSVYKPFFNNKVLDRFLVIAESSKIPVIIVINKTDLDPDNLIDEWVYLYNKIGYKVILTSAETKEGTDLLGEVLKGKTSFLWGQSGVGKSTLLNTIFPHLHLVVGEVSKFTNKGKHSTVMVRMIKTGDETYIVDTPGVREIDPYGLRKEDLGHYFIEFEPYINNCKYNTCTHNHEPGCAIIEAAENGEISADRYDSYLRILETVEEDIKF